MNTQEKLPLSIIVVITIALSLATFMQVLDTTIANVSIPAIAGNLGVSPQQGTWVITAFAAANAIAMPLTGWLAKRFGEVRLFVASTLLFSITSLLSGLSSSYEVLIFWRVVQGAVAAPMMPLSQSLLLANYPHEKQGLALAFWAMTVTIGPIVGPLLGGYITDNLNWSWIFFINVPIGLLSSFLVWELLHDRETECSSFSIDYIGLGLLILGIGTLQVMLDKGNDLDWFSSTMIITLAIIATVSITIFIIWELYDENPVIDLTLFKDQNFTVGTISISLGYAVFLGGGVVFPLWLQTQLGYTAYWAGFATAAVGVFAFLLSPVIGANLHRMNLRVLVTLSFLIFAVSYFWMSNFTTGISVDDATIPRLLMGVGMAMFFVPLTSIIISNINPKQNASAMGVVNFLRMIGGSFGTSIAINLWSNQAVTYHAYYAESINHTSHTAESIRQTLSHIIDKPYAYIDRIITQQAYTSANDDIFLYSGYIFLALIAVVWFAKPPFMKARAKK